LRAIISDFEMIGRTGFAGKGDDADQWFGQALFCDSNIYHAFGEVLVRIGRSQR